jgi:hypothetical protein
MNLIMSINTSLKKAEKELAEGTYWDCQKVMNSKPEEIEKYLERAYNRGLFSRIDESKYAKVKIE